LLLNCALKLVEEINLQSYTSAPHRVFRECCMADFTFILCYSQNPSCGNYSSPLCLIKHVVTQIKELKYGSNNIFIYFYWLHKQYKTVTKDALQFSRCLFTAMRTIISELQMSGCNYYSGIFFTSKCLCNNS